MSEKTTVRMYKKLKEAIERDAREQGVPSYNEWVVKACEHFLDCKKAFLTPSMRLIVLKYPGECLKCGRYCDVGEWACYGRGVGIVCLDCFIKRVGDETLIAKDLKLREIKRLYKAYKKNVDEMAKRFEKYPMYERTYELYEIGTKWDEYAEGYFRKMGSVLPEKEKELVQLLIKTSQQLIESCVKMKDSLIQEPNPKKKRKDIPVV